MIENMRGCLIIDHNFHKCDVLDFCKPINILFNVQEQYNNENDVVGLMYLKHWYFLLKQKRIS